MLFYLVGDNRFVRAGRGFGFNRHRRDAFSTDAIQSGVPVAFYRLVAAGGRGAAEGAVMESL